MSAPAILAGFRTLRRTQGVDITYRRGVETVDLVAVLGQSDHEVADAQGVVTTWQSRDVLVEAALLILAGQPTKPQRGDEVLLALGAETGVWRVQFPDPNRPPFKFSDPYQQILRIHTTQTG